MDIDLIFPAHPPDLDGIGDYTARLAETLAAEHEVRILTARAAPETIPGVTSERAFTLTPRRRVADVVEAIAARRPDAVVLQYNPFSYGRWGLNLHLPLAFRDLKSRCPNTVLGLMVHEPFVPLDNVRFAVMTLWQRWQLWSLGRTADLAAFSIAPWAERFDRWFPNTRTMHLPVSSNMPHAGLSQAAARRRLDLDPETLLMGVFGSAHASRLLPFIREAAAAVVARRPDTRVLYVGPHGADVRAALDGASPLMDTGPLSAEDVSRHLAACDLYLAPFRKGVSTRRGSFMVGIQHGIATVSTIGVQTDAMLREVHGHCFLLAPDDERATFAHHAQRLATDTDIRTRVARGGEAFFREHFAWHRIADQLAAALAAAVPHREPSTA